MIDFKDIEEDHISRRFGISDISRYINDPLFRKQVSKLSKEDSKERNKIHKRRFNLDKIV